jgi:hypothetical protein
MNENIEIYENKIQETVTGRGTCEMHAALLDGHIQPTSFLANLMNVPLLSLEGLSKGNHLIGASFMLLQRILNSLTSFSFCKLHARH